MKIDINTVNEDVKPIELFYNGCKSPNTKSQYAKALRRVLFEFMEDVLTEETFLRDEQMNWFSRLKQIRNGFLRSVISPLFQKRLSIRTNCQLITIIVWPISLDLPPFGCSKTPPWLKKRSDNLRNVLSNWSSNHICYSPEM